MVTLMKKTLRAVCYFLLFCVLLRACGALHKHDWAEATCTEPRTCTTCKVTEGDPLGHVWQEATCTSPEICSVCGATQGWRADHIWVDATCTEPERCSVCGTKRHWYSLPNGHEWQDATCTIPKTCSVCGATDGEPEHYFGYYWNTTVDATCYSSGVKETACLYCGYVKSEEIPIIDHKAGSWECIQKATPSANGIFVRCCEMCGLEMDREEREYIDYGITSNGSSNGSGNNFNTYNNQSQQETTASYVLNKKTKKFHHPSCSDVPKIAPKNYSVSSETRETIISMGYQPCGHCAP